jgi:MFS family permease
MKLLHPAHVVILAGVSAALHIGKLPPALPVLRDTLGISLVQSGFLLSMVQLAGMTLGLATGLMADGFGLRRSMLTGLLLLSACSLAGGFASSAGTLLVLRAFEGMGILMVTMPAPSLIRHLVEPQRMSATLGVWGAYMPLGTATALLAGPWVMALAGWQVWWWLLALVSLALGLAMFWLVPPPPLHVLAATAAQTRPWAQRLRLTLGSSGPWLVALSFAAYSGQWLAVIGFLPSIYAQAGITGTTAGMLSALAAAVNIVGNVMAGRLLQRGWQAPVLLSGGFLAMGSGALLAFDGPDSAAMRYAAVLLFSTVGGLVPSTLFSLAVRLAPAPDTVSATVGMTQQCSSLGQFIGPPLVAWVATQSGSWRAMGWVVSACSLAGLGLTWALRRRLLRAR